MSIVQAAFVFPFWGRMGEGAVSVRFLKVFCAKTCLILMDIYSYSVGPHSMQMCSDPTAGQPTSVARKDGFSILLELRTISEIP